MRRSTPEILIDNFAKVYPYFAERAVRYHQDGPNTLVVKLSDGKTIWYDDFNRSFRRLPDDPNNMTQEQFNYEFRRRVEKMLEFRMITQKDLAHKIGMDPGQLSRYMNGQHVPGFYIIDKIARALDCSVDELRYTGRKEN